MFIETPAQGYNSVFFFKKKWKPRGLTKSPWETNQQSVKAVHGRDDKQKGGLNYKRNNPKTYWNPSPSRSLPLSQIRGQEESRWSWASDKQQPSCTFPQDLWAIIAALSICTPLWNASSSSSSLAAPTGAKLKSVGRNLFLYQFYPAFSSHSRNNLPSQGHT